MNKRVIAIMMLLIMFGNTVLATENIIKNSESIYVNIDEYGKVEKLNVSEKYQLSNVDKIEKYGKYYKIKNLTSDKTPIISGDKIEWNVSGDKEFAYIAELDLKEAEKLPWKINIKYELNGVETLANELVGKNGLVKVIIELIPNEKAPEYYKNQYMLEVTSSYNMNKYLSVYSKDAIEVNVGNTKQLLFVVLPGQEKTIEIEIGTEDFEMDGLMFALVPLQGDILEAIENIAENKNDLEDAINSTNKSMDVLLNQMSYVTKNLNGMINGTENLQNGVNKIHANSDERLNNLEILKNSLKEIDTLSNSVKESIQYAKERVTTTKEEMEEVKNYLKDFSNDLNDIEKDLDILIDVAEDLPKGIENLRKVLIDTKDIVGNLENLLRNFDMADEIDINAIAKGLAEIGIKAEALGQEAYGKLESGEGDSEFYSKVLEVSQKIGNDLLDVKAELEKIGDLNESGSKDIAKIVPNLVKLEKDLGKLANSIDNLGENTEDLSKSIESMQDCVKNINEILNIVTDSLDQNLSGDTFEIINLFDNITEMIVQLQVADTSMQSVLQMLQSELRILDNEIYNAGNKTIDASQNLLKDFTIMTKESNSLKNSKDVIYNVVKKNFDDLESNTNLMKVNSEQEIKSFVSEKNKTPDSVEFFIKTKSINKENMQDIVDFEKKVEKVSLWEKIKRIFKKIGDFFINLFK